MSTGVLLTRCQPLHYGHIKVLQQMLTENDKVVLVIGSADKSSTERNPFDIRLRYELSILALRYYNMQDKVQIATLSDWSSDSDIPKQDNLTGSVDEPRSVAKEWGSYLYYNLVNITESKHFTFYYNDDTSLVKEWFPAHTLARVTIKSCERFDDFSSSAIRKALTECDMSYLLRALPFLTREQIIKLRYIITTNKEVEL